MSICSHVFKNWTKTSPTSVICTITQIDNYTVTLSNRALSSADVSIVRSLHWYFCTSGIKFSFPWLLCFMALFKLNYCNEVKFKYTSIIIYVLWNYMSWHKCIYRNGDGLKFWKTYISHIQTKAVFTFNLFLSFIISRMRYHLLKICRCWQQLPIRCLTLKSYKLWNVMKTSFFLKICTIFPDIRLF